MIKAWLLALFFAAALIAACNTPSDSGGSSPFEVISASRTDYVKSTYNTIGWKKDGKSNGVVLVLKYVGPDKSKYLFSAEFALAYGKENDPGSIPRRHCLGVTSGREKADGHPSWVLGRGPLRMSASQEKPYFSLLFGDVPKDLNGFTLKYAEPIAKGIKVK